MPALIPSPASREPSRRLSPLLRMDLVRSEKAVQHLTTFVVAAVATILVTRAFLALSGYPRIGGDSDLHVAHVLPGGLLMLAALVLQFAYVGRGPRPVAALLGGIGFGLFIDEVGKFVTADNDYFFEPAAAIMYVVFAGLVVGAYWWRRHRTLEDDEVVANAAHVLVDGLAGRLPASRRDEVLRSLERVPDSPGAAELRTLLAAVEPAPAPVPARLEHLWARVGRAFDRAAHRPWAVPAMAVLLLVQATGSTLTVAALQGSSGGLGVSGWGVLVGASASLLFSLVAVVQARRAGRRAAVESLQRAVLVSLLVTQVFLFATSQFAATAGLVVDLVLLGLVNADVARMRAQGED
ncbi:hypothetical protein [Kineococcus sp. SYSU DK004]|uniref:hypothetical protein n=1 Tax=Kineococcus sp. SYSU DK004 TaxID=3383125 RepID=UPI003D7ECE6A